MRRRLYWNSDNGSVKVYELNRFKRARRCNASLFYWDNTTGQGSQKEVEYDYDIKRGENMTRAISIRPSKDLRSNYAQISSLAKQNPVAITVNGKEDTVVLSHEDYIDQMNYVSELEARLSVYQHLAQAADDIKLGRIQNANEAFDDILSELDDLDL